MRTSPESLCVRDFALEYPHCGTGSFARFKAKQWCVLNHSVVYVESLIFDSRSPNLTLV